MMENMLIREGRAWLIQILIVTCLLLWPAFSKATEMNGIANSDKGTKSSALLTELAENFEYSLRMLTFGTYQNVANSSQNPDNGFFQIPCYLAQLELRPDASLYLNRLELSIKPRADIEWASWEEGIRKGDTDWDNDWFINEWLARIRMAENLFVSYGRENLQWGPSFLFSPSNPFFQDNGRSNPKQEVSGMDFARLVWLSGMSLTVSLIANVDKGRQEFPFFDFDRTYALKVDYSGQEGYASLIMSHKEGVRNRLGAFGGLTASDALLLYGEATVSKGTDVLYAKDADNAFGGSMEPADDKNQSLQGIILAGGSYTLEMGPILTIEYVYNGPGYSDDQAKAYYRLREEASDAFDVAGPIGNLSGLTLSQTADPRLSLLRRNYLMLQYQHSDIGNLLNLIFRWTRNMDDGSGQFISIMEYYVGDHIELFSVGTLNSGGGNTEFGALLDCQLMIGLEYTF